SVLVVVAAASANSLTVSCEFDQWYDINQDLILAAWSNASAGLNLSDSPEDQARLAELWNDTLRGLYGAELPWDSESAVAVTDDAGQSDETYGNSVLEDVAAGSESTLTFSSDFERWYYSNREAILAAWQKVFLSVDLNDTGVNGNTSLVDLWNNTLSTLYGAPLPYLTQSSTESVTVHSDSVSQSGDSLLTHAKDSLEHPHRAGVKHEVKQTDLRDDDNAFLDSQMVSGALAMSDAPAVIVSPLEAYLTIVFSEALVLPSESSVASPTFRQFGGLIASILRYAETSGSRSAAAENEGVSSLSAMNQYSRTTSAYVRTMTAGLDAALERTPQPWSPLSQDSEASTVFLISSERMSFKAGLETSTTTGSSQGSSISSMLGGDRTRIRGISSTTLASAQRREFDQAENSQSGSSATARYERLFRLLHRYWKALKARYSGARTRVSAEPADEVIVPEMKLQNGLSAQLACQRLKYFIVARGPPSDDLPPDSGWTFLCNGSDQLTRLRHVIAPRGPSSDLAQQQVQVSSPFRGLISAESMC
ncbi:MAG: hypothetical protein ACK58L_12040, partial [Planctomycetota bacterium]